MNLYLDISGCKTKGPFTKGPLNSTILDFKNFFSYGYSRKKFELGVTIVEFAIIMPLFLIFIFGIIEFGILMYDRAVIIDASRMGARAGVVYRYNPDIEDLSHPPVDEIQSKILSYCEENLISLNSATLDVPPPEWSCPQAGCTIKVRVNYNFKFLIFSNLLSLAGSFPGGIPLNSETVMRLE